MEKRNTSLDKTELAEQKRKLLEYLLREEGVEIPDPDTIPPTEQAGDVPASFAQQRLWFLEQLDPGSPIYNIPAAVRLSGKLDVAALENSLNATMQRHESLRTHFLAGDRGPVQIVVPEITLRLSVIDLTHLEHSHREEAALQLAAQDASRGFDLARAPLMRVSLLNLGESDHILLFTLHHIISDGWSMGVIIREIATLYDALVSGRDPHIPELPIQYRDYACWQRKWLQGPVLEEQLEYWRQQLGGELPVLELPADHPRPAVQSPRGAFESQFLSRAVSDEITALSRREGVTLFVTLLAAFKTLLYRYSAQQDVLVGIPIANRNRQEIEGLIGLFANTLVLRTDLSGDPGFRQLLFRVRDVALGAYAHQDLPFEKLVEELHPVRHVSHTPLFQVMFALQNAPMPDIKIGGLELSPMSLGSGTSKFDLMLAVEELPQGIKTVVEYKKDLFEPDTARRLLSHYQALLEAIITNPDERISRLRFLTQHELQSIALRWKRPLRASTSRKTLVELFEEQAEARGDAVAATFEDEELTYGELNRRANKVARYLRRLGALPETYVGICVDRSMEMVVGLLGIVKSGAAYVPVDASYPRERVSFILEDSGVEVLVTEEGLVGGLGEGGGRRVCIDREWDQIEEESWENVEAVVEPENAAYVIYTSGSTGRPKGVVVSHRNVGRLFEATKEKMEFTEEDVWSLFHSCAFDFSVWELWGALMYGGRVVVVPYWVSRNPEAYRELVEREGVTIVNQTPTAMRQFIEAEERRKGERVGVVRAVILGGEELEVTSLRRWIEEHGDEKPQIINMYGITETTVHVSYRRIRREDVEGGEGSPIGKAIEDLQIYVLDGELEAEPISVVGEMWVGGEGVARCYLNEGGLTAERFRPDPWSERGGERMYGSGDLGRMRRDREIEYVGRKDDQVKIRGFRIEVGEVEAALNRHAGVGQSAVVAQEGRGGEKRLVAYVKVRGEEHLSMEELRGYLKEKLPEYMVPAAIVEVEGIPLTEHGKLDRKALPEVDWSRREGKGAYEAPSNEVERGLAEVWSSVLGVEQVGIRDNFFDLGGDSILSIQIRSRARQKGIDFSLQQLFRYQTIRELAGQICGGSSGGVTPEELDRSPRDGRFRLLSERDRSKIPADCENAYPLSELQAGMVFHSEYSADYIAYITSFHLRVAFDREKLQLSLDQMSARHEMLRTSFDVTSYGEPLQLVHKTAPLILAIEDLRHLLPAEQELHIEEWATTETRRRFDWAIAPLIRVHVHVRGDDSIQFSLTEPFFDGWSVASFLTELFERYFALLSGSQLPVEPLLEASYEDFVELEREALQSESCRRYWESKLADATSCRLPCWPVLGETCNPREVVRMEVELPVEVSNSLKGLARTAGVSLKSVLLAAHLKVVSLLSGQTDAIAGLLINGRPERIDGERLLGAFLNTAPFKLNLEETSWLDLVRKVFAAENELLPFRRCPIQELQRLYQAEKLFDTVFNYTHFHVLDRLRGLPQLEVLSQTGSEQTYFALTAQFNIDGATSRIRLELDYRTIDLGQQQVSEIAGYYRRVLASMASDPMNRHQLCLVSERELKLISELNDTRKAISSDECIHVLFEAQAARRPDSIAVVIDDRQLTYCELNRLSNQMAHRLNRMGVGPETLVGICIRRSAEMIVALLGILKAGGAYLPLDAEHPRERVRFILDDSRAPIVITGDESGELCSGVHAKVLEIDSQWNEIANESGENPFSVVMPESLAYVIYTSGSTGKPKGVLIQHRGVTNVIEASTEAFGITKGCRIAQLASLSFDASVLEIFTALTAGATLCLISREVVASGVDLAKTLIQQNITAAIVTPSNLDRLPAGDLGALTTVVSGGEACGPDTAARWSRGRRLWNAYAPTEATIYASSRLCDEGVRLAPTLGRPIANMRIYSLATDLNPVPIGVAGELFVGGCGVARGYLNRPELTAERFIPDAFSADAGTRLYRTGDLARLRVDSELEFLGRSDHQVKIRGFRIELGEIESVLGANPEVKETVVILWKESGGDARLVAYVVPGDPDRFSPSALRSYLKEKLPEYMVPSGFVSMESLPRTETGKIDRRRLPAPEHARPTLAQSYIDPRTPMEEMLALTWAEVLGIDRVGIRDDFFELGGHSLSATQAISRVRAAFNADLPLRALFENPTIEGLAARLEEAVRSRHGVKVEAIRRARHSGPLPLSFAQQRLWFLDQFEPGSPLYNIAAGVSISGPLDIATLERAIQEITKRHDSLRTTFSSNAGTPIQIISDSWEITLEVTDLRGAEPDDRIGRARGLAAREASEPFSLEAGPLVRTRLLQIDDYSWWLLLTMHHIVSDGWSIGVFVQELAGLYEAFSQGKPSPLSELSIQYGDFAVWQRDWLAGDALGSQLEYWKEQLAASPPLLELPTDRPRPPVQTWNGAVESLPLGAEITIALKRLGRVEGATLFMTLLTAFDVLAYRYTGQQDVLVGTPIANRNRPDVESLIGFFVNTVVLRADLSGEPAFRDLLARVKETALNAYAHQDLPFEKLVEELNPTRSLSYSPLFQVMLDVQNAPLRPLQLQGLRLEPLALEACTAKFDLTFTFAEAGGGLVASLEYNTDLFEAATIHRMLGHFRNLLEQAAATPSISIAEIRLMSDSEIGQLLEESNDTDTDYPTDQCIHDLFKEQVSRTPDRVAVVFGEERLTFSRLDLRASQLAARLGVLGVRPESLVGICIERSAELMVALLGVLKSGAAYVPLDPSSPSERLDLLVRDSGIEVLLTEERLIGTSGAGNTAVICLDRDRDALESMSPELPGGVSPDNLAYVIYTSGSTGKPKGVSVTHRALVNSTLARLSYYSEPLSAFLLLSPVAFDSSVAGIFWGLCGGGTLVIPSEESIVDPERLGEVISAQSISHLLTLPAFYSLILDHVPVDLLNSLRVAIVAGEACPVDLLTHHERCCPGVPLFNEYGPTEATVWSSVACCRSTDQMWRVPIGRPISNARMYVLDSRLHPVPRGVAGELYIAGNGLARGYLDRPDLTAERFTPDPFGSEPGSRMYKTGDLGRLLQNGNIEFLGRNDFQVKLRGMRIELGEIESVLRQNEKVSDAVVTLAEGSQTSDKRLVAYVVEQSAGGSSARELTSYLKEKLPDYMVPSTYVAIAELPLNPNGKVNRMELASLDGADLDDDDRYEAPETPVEKVIAGIWEAVLGRRRVGAVDNFFEIGGHSLLATQAMSRVKEALRIEIGLRKLFEEPTVKGLARTILAPEETRATVERTAEILLRLSELSDDDAELLLHEKRAPKHKEQAG